MYLYLVHIPARRYMLASVLGLLLKSSLFTTLIKQASSYEIDCSSVYYNKRNTFNTINHLAYDAIKP